MKHLAKTSQKDNDFVSSEQKAKSEKIEIIEKIVRLARKERLSYDDFIYVCGQARKKLELKRPRTSRKLPQLLTETELKRFFQVIQACGNLQHAHYVEDVVLYSS